MQTWTTSTFLLEPGDRLSVCPHEGSASLSLPGYVHGRGFAIQFHPAHLAPLRELCRALETLDAQRMRT